MHEAALARAALPSPTSILFLPLRPYALGHELTLLRRENPLVSLNDDDLRLLPASDRTLAIVEAADVCAHTWAQNSWRPTDSRQERRVLRNTARWHRRIVGADWAGEIERFRAYRMAGVDSFPASLPSGPNAGETRYLGAPELLNLYQFVVAHIPVSERAAYSLPGALNSQPLGLVGWVRLVVRRALDVTAWDYPLGLARMQKQAHDEMDGRLNIYNHFNFMHDQALEKLKAELAAAAETKTTEEGGAHG